MLKLKLQKDKEKKNPRMKTFALGNKAYTRCRKKLRIHSTKRKVKLSTISTQCNLLRRSVINCKSNETCIATKVSTSAVTHVMRNYNENNMSLVLREALATCSCRSFVTIERYFSIYFSEVLITVMPTPLLCKMCEM